MYKINFGKRLLALCYLFAGATIINCTNCGTSDAIVDLQSITRDI